VDELYIGELGGRSVKEDVLVKSHVGVSKASDEAVCRGYVANVSNRVGERRGEARTPALTRRRSVHKPAVSVSVLAPPHFAREPKWLAVGEVRAWQRCGRL
jgi:hypothetical protein